MRREDRVRGRGNRRSAKESGLVVWRRGESGVEFECRDYIEAVPDRDRFDKEDGIFGSSFESPPQLIW